MKTILTMFATVGLLVASTTVSLAAPTEKWAFSAEQRNIAGSFVYSLHYLDSPQLLSKVSLPQNQALTLFGLTYHLPRNRFIRGQFGQTGLGNQGRGDDSDWTKPGQDVLTDYGEMNAYGRQKQLALDFGKVLAESRRSSTRVLFGWSQQKTANELRDVVYHLSEGKDIGAVSQPDDGSYLNGKFSGFHVGLENTFRMNSRLAMQTGLSVAYLDAKTYGHWSNHTPAWDWVDAGNTFGYNLNAALQYNIRKNLSAELGYFNQFAKATGCDEVLNGSFLPGMVDLKYAQHGMRFGLQYSF